MANTPWGLDHRAASAPQTDSRGNIPCPAIQATDGRVLHLSGANSDLPAEAEREQLLYRLSSGLRTALQRADSNERGSIQVF